MNQQRSNSNTWDTIWAPKVLDTLLLGHRISNNLTTNLRWPHSVVQYQLLWNYSYTYYFKHWIKTMMYKSFYRWHKSSIAYTGAAEDDHKAGRLWWLSFRASSPTKDATADKHAGLRCLVWMAYLFKLKYCWSLSHTPGGKKEGGPFLKTRSSVLLQQDNFVKGAIYSI